MDAALRTCTLPTPSRLARHKSARLEVTPDVESVPSLVQRTSITAKDNRRACQFIEGIRYLAIRVCLACGWRNASGDESGVGVELGEQSYGALEIIHEFLAFFVFFRLFTILSALIITPWRQSINTSTMFIPLMVPKALRGAAVREPVFEHGLEEGEL